MRSDRPETRRRSSSLPSPLRTAIDHACHAIAPALEELATQHAGELTVAKLNVDENSDIALDYEVMSFPTLIVFENGVEKKRIVGAQPKAHIEAELAEFIG